MKSKNSFSLLSKIYGIVITSLFVLIFVPKLIISIVENGIEGIKEIGYGLFHWYDDPTGLFFAYIIGYGIAWIKPLWGSIIITGACIFVVVINLDNVGFLLFAIPMFLVGLFYFLYWNEERKTAN